MFRFWAEIVAHCSCPSVAVVYCAMWKHHRRRPPIVREYVFDVFSVQCVHTWDVCRSTMINRRIIVMSKICDQRKRVVQLIHAQHRCSVFWSVFVFFFHIIFFRFYPTLVTSHLDPSGHIRRIDSTTWLVCGCTIVGPVCTAAAAAAAAASNREVV